MMVSLCRDYEFALFKFDAVAGQLRDEKQEAFEWMMDECRSPPIRLRSSSGNWYWCRSRDRLPS